MTRSFFLWASKNKKLQESLPRYRFIRNAVKRFMPGENLSDALLAAEKLQTQGLFTVLTYLGENVTQRTDAEAAASQYTSMLDEIAQRKLASQPSVKLTQLGFDLDVELCYLLMDSILKKAAGYGNFVWIDMESSAYATRTIDFFRRLRETHDNTGLCLQSYLYRTKEDLSSLLPLQPAIRLVKGAYAEPPEIAFPKKTDNDENYFALARQLLLARKEEKSMVAIGTHDLKLIGRIQEEAHKIGLAKNSYEVQMLYGIKSEEQLRLAAEGHKVRVLISYGSYWFPWYMRRLAERPANVWFVLKSVFG